MGSNVFMEYTERMRTDQNTIFTLIQSFNFPSLNQFVCLFFSFVCGFCCCRYFFFVNYEQFSL